MKVKYFIPPLYENLLSQELLNKSFTETKATCDDCAEEKYQKDLKCCTFHPFMPNYLVGALFEDVRTPETVKKILRDKINKRHCALPIGILAPIPYQVAFNKRKPKDFGNRRDWLCPYYNLEQNNCSIWRYRSSVCSTFICHSSYGKKGLKFWDQLNNYLSYVEMGLLEEVLAYKDFSPRQMNDCLEYVNRKKATQAELKTKALPLAKAKKLWNGYFNEQEKFYRDSYKLVLDFNRKRVQEILGETGEQLYQSLMAASSL